MKLKKVKKETTKIKKKQQVMEYLGSFWPLAWGSLSSILSLLNTLILVGLILKERKLKKSI